MNKTELARHVLDEYTCRWNRYAFQSEDFWTLVEDLLTRRREFSIRLRELTPSGREVLAPDLGPVTEEMSEQDMNDLTWWTALNMNARLRAIIYTPYYYKNEWHVEFRRAPSHAS